MENIDQKIMQLFDVVKTQREEVSKAEKESKQSWKTNCSIIIGNSPNPQNIQVLNETGIKQVVTELLIERKYSQEACTILGLECEDKHQNFSFEDWIADCVKRIAVINLKQKKDKLNKLEERLQAIVSPEQKRAMELESITKSLGI